MEEWLASIGLGDRIEAFREQRIDLDQLTDLTEQDLRELGLTIGERRRFQRALASRAVVEPPLAMEPETRSGENRPLTVMFVDLVGSTSIGERVDPEDLLDIIRIYREFCGKAIARFGGHIARFLGDGILAYFCYPVANENDPERAVRAGLEIVQGIDSLVTPAGEPLQVRIGLATGRVIVSDLLAGGAADSNTIIGSCPNLAARLQSLAGTNEIVIAERTYARVASQFQCEPLGTQHLHGFDQPHEVWRVVAERGTAGASPLNAPQSLFVGRESELELLGILWRRAQQGKGAAALITGEAGMGKSRLVEQFLSLQRITEAETLKVVASAFSQNSPLKPFVDYIRGAAGIALSDTADTTREKLEGIVLLANDRQPLAIATLMSLLGFGKNDPAIRDLSPEQLREETIEVIAEQLLALAVGPPVCFVLEDLHWLDQTSQDLMSMIVDRIHDYRILLLVTSRPDGAGAIASRTDTTLRLSPLTHEDVASLVHELLGQGGVAKVSELIVNRTDGVPLFVEEVARTLIHRSGEADTLEHLNQLIPSSLEETLVARLDRAGTAKEVAQVASLIGRVFRRDVLAASCQIDQVRLSAALTSLVKLGILERVRNSSPESYTFRHVLLRDTAYSSLLRERRRDLHDRVARALPIFDPDGIALYPETLAHHLTEAGRIEEATPLFIEAARRSLTRSALVEATSVLQRALTELERRPETPGTLRLRVQVSSLLGPVLIGLKGASAPETQRLYTSAYQVCQKLPDDPAHFPILWGWWRISPYSPERAPALLRHAQAANDPELLLEAHHCSWAVQFNLGNFQTCREHMTAGLAIYDSGDFTHHAPLYGNHDPKVCAHGNLSQLCWMEGRLHSALLEEQRSLAWAEKTDHLGSRVHAMGLTLLHRVYRRDYREVYQRSTKLVEFTAAHGMADHSAAGLIFQGWVLGMQEDPGRGLALIEEGLAKQRQVATDEDLAVYLCLLAEVLMALGRPEEAAQRITLDKPTLDASKIWIWYPELLRVLGDATMAIDNRRSPNARKLYEEAAALARQQGVPMLGLRIALSRARLDFAEGNTDTGCRLLASALELIPEADSAPELIEAEGLLRAAHFEPS